MSASETFRRWSPLPGRRSLLALIRAPFRLFVNARPGAEHGAFQLVGWRTVKVTRDMVGMTIAQFAAVETRTRGKRRLSPEEQGFAREVRAAGGFAGIAQIVNGRACVGEVGEE